MENSNVISLVTTTAVQGRVDRESRLTLLSEQQKEILELAARDAPIGDALNALVRAAQLLRGPETRAAVFIFDPDAAKLKFAAAAGLSAAYTRAIDGFPVGPTQPSCGQAAYVGDDVIVRDVAQDALWAPYLQLAAEHGIRACWSFLLRGPKGDTLGTFALYHGEPVAPDPADYAELRYFARIASLLIERHAVAETRRDEEKSRRDGDDDKDHLLAVLAHELRNPLGALKSALRVAQLAGGQPQSRDRALEVMSRQLTQMEWLIEDLLDANRMARGELKLQLQRMALRPVLELAVETVLPQCRQKGQRMACAMPPDDVIVDADGVRLVQMVTNLLNNACKFTAAGGSIALDVSSSAQGVAIHVKDDGVGLAPEERDGIFTMFAQRAGDARRSGGLGIGLALVKDLAALHGGSIEAHSQGLGLGSEFILRLPVPAAAR